MDRGRFPVGLASAECPDVDPGPVCQSACLLSTSSLVLFWVLLSVNLFYLKDDSDDAVGDDNDNEDDYDDYDKSCSWLCVSLRVSYPPPLSSCCRLSACSLDDDADDDGDDDDDDSGDDDDDDDTVVMITTITTMTPTMVMLRMMIWILFLTVCQSARLLSTNAVWGLSMSPLPCLRPDPPTCSFNFLIMRMIVFVIMLFCWKRCQHHQIMVKVMMILMIGKLSSEACWPTVAIHLWLRGHTIFVANKCFRPDDWMKCCLMMTWGRYSAPRSLCLSVCRHAVVIAQFVFRLQTSSSAAIFWWSRWPPSHWWHRWHM